MIRRSLHIDKIQKKKYFIPYSSNFVIKILFLSKLLHIFQGGGRKIVPKFLLRNLSKRKMFSPANQIARNKHNAEELDL